ncbi:MAG: hypothetical protein HYV90_01550 [Candidatus Woesebacteria bacterium]|nr:MAG: hypothetical protein HYV90_01550 [Candidatus Woesebacteria bacterium]
MNYPLNLSAEPDTTTHLDKKAINTYNLGVNITNIVLLKKGESNVKKIR